MYINKTVKLKKSCVQNYYNEFCIMAALYILPHYIYLAQVFHTLNPQLFDLMIGEGAEG